MLFYAIPTRTVLSPTGLIDCDDNDIGTLDICSPSQGCVFLRFNDYIDDLNVLDARIAELEEEEGEVIFYEDKPTLTEAETLAIINWLVLEVTQLRTDFCWRRSYGRGAGEVLNTCPSNKEKIGALCYSPCPSGKLYEAELRSATHSLLIVF